MELTNKFHKFLTSQIDQERCAICRYYRPNHICEICGLSLDSNEHELELTVAAGNILMCHDCNDAENKLQSENNTPEKIQERIDIQEDVHSIALRASQIMDKSIQVRTDLFNAEVVAIVDLKNIIDNDPNVTNKHYTLAEELKKRFEHFQSVIFAKQNEIVETANSQRAIQVYLNELANKLRSEEREKLKISDINYKPNDVSKVIKVPKIKVNKPKLDKELLNSTAKELGIPVFTLQSFVTAKNCSIEAAANMIRASLGK
jgi:phosphatidate phosphatase PAH1